MSYICKTAVLLIFFNRPDNFAKVFEKVREARPQSLILAQDGPRHEADKPGIEACRRIAENVDWECEVVREYSDVNLGCGARPKSAIDFALKLFDRVIILEDDCVPSSSFFRYCDELLERYKDDERIGYISGLNHFETWDCGEYDYFFSNTAAIWGWATWRRAWQRYYDYFAQGVHDSYRMKLYRMRIANQRIYKGMQSALLRASISRETQEKISYWDTQWGFALLCQSMLSIVPRENQICNIGVGEGATHAKNVLTTTFVKYRSFFFIPTHELNLPLRHPDFCIGDDEYSAFVKKSMRASIVTRIFRRIQKQVYSILYS